MLISLASDLGSSVGDRNTIIFSLKFLLLVHPLGSNGISQFQMSTSGRRRWLQTLLAACVGELLESQAALFFCSLSSTTWGKLLNFSEIPFLHQKKIYYHLGWRIIEKINIQVLCGTHSVVEAIIINDFSLFAKKEITYWSLFKLCFYINLQTLFKKFLVLMLGLLLAW